MISQENCRTVVLLSGNGSNLQALMDHQQQDKLPIDICAVISNRADAFGLVRATNAGIATEYLDHRAHINRENFDRQLLTIIESYKPDLLVLAGFMRVLTAQFVRHYKGRMLNIHPSLLPAYPGLKTHQRVLDAGEKQHGGCSGRQPGHERRGVRETTRRAPQRRRPGLRRKKKHPSEGN